jgi:hypothetical protein
MLKRHKDRNKEKRKKERNVLKKRKQKENRTKI